MVAQITFINSAAKKTCYSAKLQIVLPFLDEQGKFYRQSVYFKSVKLKSRHLPDTNTILFVMHAF